MSELDFSPPSPIGSGGQRMHNERSSLPKNFPPVVYLPILTDVQQSEDAQIMLRRTRDGRIACLAYSALDRLLNCCGNNQPWMWTPTVALDALQRSQPFDLLLLDVYIPEEQRGFRGYE
ncbi:SAV_915 family protein [Nocardia farcinica]|uniref:SAV_915 family protein n=2 Tax=Nocardia farcinica TaxID=37329 RepID=UPI0024569F31|nr:SAV_915 family protein [Nocardia farcinica]